jgi:predicted nucleic acid-binding Zn ribbon protein
MDAPQDREIRGLQEDLQRRRPKTRGPRKMADVLSGLMARRGYAQQLSHGQCAEAWRQSVGEHLARHSHAGVVRRGVLEVTVRNSTVMQELSFQKKRLLQQLAQLVPDQRIRDVRFRVGAIPTV